MTVVEPSETLAAQLSEIGQTMTEEWLEKLARTVAPSSTPIACKLSLKPGRASLRRPARFARSYRHVRGVSTCVPFSMDFTEHHRLRLPFAFA
jgi:hypothetical protein